MSMHLRYGVDWDATMPNLPRPDMDRPELMMVVEVAIERQEDGWKATALHAHGGRTSVLIPSRSAASALSLLSIVLHRYCGRVLLGD